jgi:hypothetical protein
MKEVRMNKDATGRRTLLQQGLALLGGGVAVAAGARFSRGARAEAAPIDSRGALKLYARIRPIAGTSPAQSQSDARTVATGDLLDAPHGKRIGEFSANCFCLGTPFGTHLNSAATIEMQVLQLHDGTLFGMSTPSAPGAPKVHAVIGGTARFAGARGTYVQRQVSAPGAHDLVEFIVTIAD